MISFDRGPSKNKVPGAAAQRWGARQGHARPPPRNRETTNKAVSAGFRRATATLKQQTESPKAVLAPFPDNVGGLGVLQLHPTSTGRAVFPWETRPVARDGEACVAHHRDTFCFFFLAFSTGGREILKAVSHVVQMGLKLQKMDRHTEQT